MRILIWDMFELHNTGGPSGYLYNIRKYLSNNPNHEIVFLSDLLLSHNNNTHENSSNNSNTKAAIDKTAYKSLWRKLLILLDHLPGLKNITTKTIDYSYRIWNLKWNINISSKELNDYDFIHFHFLLHIRQFKNTFPDYNGLKILTTHSPCPWTYETIDADHSISFLKRYLIKQECKSYTFADYLMFPCPQAKEPYNKNKRIRNTLEKLENKTFYVSTSLLYDNDAHSLTQKRSSYNIPENALLIGYFGRHNHIKGYDILKRIASDTLSKCPNLYIICAGSGDIEPLNHPRWQELGFISNVREVMDICDLYVLPNRETYFDIVLLEALRAGMITLVSETGGNKFFQTLPTYSTKGIFYFDINNTESAVNQIFRLYSLKEDNPDFFDKLKKNNTKLFEEYFTMNKYVSSYLNVLKRIISNNLSSYHNKL